MTMAMCLRTFIYIHTVITESEVELWSIVGLRYYEHTLNRLYTTIVELRVTTLLEVVRQSVMACILILNIIFF